MWTKEKIHRNITFKFYHKTIVKRVHVTEKIMRLTQRQDT